jgi:hypothetical protein
MTVREAYDVLRQLMWDGHYDMELVAKDTRNGCSSSVSIYSGELAKVTDEDDCGTLCDREVGTEYVAVYLDH